MSLVMGLIHDDRMYIAGDRGSTTGGIQFVADEPKVWRWCNFSDAYQVLVGVTGMPRIQNLVRYELSDISVLLKGSDSSPEEWVYHSFAHNLKRVAESDGIKVECDGDGWTVMVLVGGQIFTIWDDFQVRRHETFFAIGSGMQSALCLLDYTLYKLNTKKEDPIVVLTEIGETVCDYDLFCRPPIDIVEGSAK